MVLHWSCDMVLLQVQKGSVVVFLRFDSINQIVFDDAEPRSILISCRDERRYGVVWCGKGLEGLEVEGRGSHTTCAGGLVLAHAPHHSCMALRYALLFHGLRTSVDSFARCGDGPHRLQG
jgi:hypothetical protein